MTTKTTPTNAATAVFEDPYISKFIFEIADEMLAKEKCRAIYKEWEKTFEHTFIYTHASPTNNKLNNFYRQPKCSHRVWFTKKDKEPTLCNALLVLDLSKNEGLNIFRIKKMTFYYRRVWMNNKMEEHNRRVRDAERKI